MNETFANTSRTLQELNDEEFILRMPSFIILVVLMFFGVIGNGLVIYVYGYRLKKSVVQYFITVLAIFDIGSCSIGVPLCLTVLRLPLLFPNDGLCKFTGLIIHVTTIASVFTLLVISVERYKTLCQPTKKVLSKKSSRYITAIISLSSVLAASPCIIIYKRIAITMPDSNDLGHECMHDPKNKFKPYFWGLLFSAVLISMSAMLVLYTLVWRRLQIYYLHVTTTYTGPDNTNFINALSTSARKKLIQTTKITFVITFLFVVSFLPCTIHQFVYRFFPNIHLSNVEKITKHIFLNLWALNSSLNPFVYGFYSMEFRREIIKIFQQKKTPAAPCTNS